MTQHWPGADVLPCGCNAIDGRVIVPCKEHLDERKARRDPLRPAIDRALDGDHRLCSLDPCSDCR